MNRYLLLAALSLGATAPALAQHEGHGTSHTPAPQAPAAQKLPPQAPAPKTPVPQPQPEAPAEPHAQHDHGDKPTAAAPDQHAGHEMSEEFVDPPEAGNDVPPDAPAEFAADRFFGVNDMNRARGILRDEHGGAVTYKIMGDMIEYRSQGGDDGYAWNGEAWFGGDIDRFVVKTEGEGGDEIESAEVQALYSRAWDHVTDLQIGIRHDIEPNPSRTYLALGFETVLPYWFEVEGALFVGERGQVLGRLDGNYEFQLTQRLVLQPRAEVNFAAKDDAAIGLGSGLSDVELGLRLRYEIQREFAPYIGVSWERKFGQTADYARADGESVETTSFVVGLRAWY
jgi:copper resistance protein B